MSSAQSCTQCPRRCAANRSRVGGFCGAPWQFSVARASLHLWEEPCISGTRGSGTVFFTGCNLRCVFCQNRDISQTPSGRLLTAEQLKALFVRLRDAGAHNINLVTPTPYALQLVSVLREIKPSLGIPIVYNCGGYESAQTLKALEGLVDIYLPDIKFFASELSERYSAAADYYERATEALAEMIGQTGAPRFDGEGLLQSGIVVRHLVLPAARLDSVALLQSLAERFGNKQFLLSLMNQYTPDFAEDCAYPPLRRRLTTFEYESVLAEAQALGFEGYLQAATSATTAYTPDFEDEGFLNMF